MPPLAVDDLGTWVGSIAGLIGVLVTLGLLIRSRRREAISERKRRDAELIEVGRQKALKEAQEEKRLSWESKIDEQTAEIMEGQEAQANAIKEDVSRTELWIRESAEDRAHLHSQVSELTGQLLETNKQIVADRHATRDALQRIEGKIDLNHKATEKWQGQHQADDNKQFEDVREMIRENAKNHSQDPGGQ